MFYYTFATLFAQLAITLRLVTASSYLTPTAHHTPRVYAVTGKNRWIASCLYSISFVQIAFGIRGTVYYGTHPSMISLPFVRSKHLRQTPMSKAMVVPDLPLDEYRICAFQLWKNTVVIFVVLSLVYGTFVLLSTTRPSTSNLSRVEDALAMSIIVYSAKRLDGGLTRVGGAPSLLDKIRRDATTYFLILSTGHLLSLLFEAFAPVGDHRVDFRSTTHINCHT